HSSTFTLQSTPSREIGNGGGSRGSRAPLLRPMQTREHLPTRLHVSSWSRPPAESPIAEPTGTKRKRPRAGALLVQTKGVTSYTRQRPSASHVRFLVHCPPLKTMR